MKYIIIFFLNCLIANIASSQWTPITALAPNVNGGSALLLSDGSVIVKALDYNPVTQSYILNKVYNKLTPDISGSYVNGTWSSIAPMADTRGYYSSQVLKDGRVYVAGGEYGSGKDNAEVYDPLANVWTSTPNPGSNLNDANSAILENGQILQAVVSAIGTPASGTLIYNAVTNTYASGPTCIGAHNEATWMKLPDNSILFVDYQTTNSERYIPSLNSWFLDATVPVQLYDPFEGEIGSALLLPQNGKALFFGNTGHNAYYTPSGTNSPGTWAAAPDFPNEPATSNPMGAPDAASAVMVNGKILCAISRASYSSSSPGDYPTPTYFYEFDPSTNVFTAISAPGGGTSLPIVAYWVTFLVLPDGNIFFTKQGSNQYYIYTPSGSPQASWRPTISGITKTGTNVYQITGTQFNGLSEGASYGDDWQMNTNYPLVRLVSGTSIYYSRTKDWNSTGVRRGSTVDNATFTLPAGLPLTTYSLYVVTNGIPSNPVQFSLVCSTNVSITGTYSAPVTQSSTWIKSSGQTTMLSTAGVSLDADPLAGYIELNPASASDFFLSAPGATGVFVAQALDGCGGVIPAKPILTPPIITTEAIDIPGLPPPNSGRKHVLHNVAEEKNGAVSIFPNPSKGSFIVKSNTYIQNAALLLLDAKGQAQKITVENMDRYSKTVKCGYISNGVYMLKIISSKKSEAVKVVIQ